ncbi:hypothetical protein [Neisseria lactamica]|uniref:hypothetical protein n=1 Tax=Neisseria lactamica TaxID=486 RepID=UPI000E56EC90|nr:hypothetical protein [Neisseria lactamica]
MIKEISETQYTFIHDYLGFSRRHQAILEGLVEWFDVLEALDDEGKEVADAAFHVEHDLFNTQNNGRDV